MGEIYLKLQGIYRLLLLGRNKRDTSGEKGQFTHHSYGHYGHQSNNYAHYGHETYVTGKVDKDGNIRDRRVSHNQVNSE